MRSDALRAGATLVELLAAMTLTSLLLGLVVGVCIAQLRLARVTAERAVITEAVRTADIVLSGEARRMTRTDVSALSSDSIALRAFRGVGLPCGATSAGVLVRYSGDRLPDPTKDSVLVIAPAGTLPLALVDARPAAVPCAALAGESVMEWRTTGSVPAAAALLVFESGSYHLTQRALRYRLGAAGRQPLTADVFQHPDSRFMTMDDRAIRFDIAAPGLPAAAHTAYFAQPGRRP